MTDELRNKEFDSTIYISDPRDSDSSFFILPQITLSKFMKMFGFQVPFFYGRKDGKENLKEYLEDVEFKVDEV